MKSRLDYQLFYERNLPHYQLPGAAVFVTYRLANSLPQQIRSRLIALRLKYKNQCEKISGLPEQNSYSERADKLLFQAWDRALHESTTGPFWLRDEKVAKIVRESLFWGDQRDYDLICFCIMPNHVHSIYFPFLSDDQSPIGLARIQHSIKRFTARKANQALGRSGDFWQHESYDRAMRDDEELRRAVNYVILNPVSAGLVSEWTDWPWTYLKERVL